MSLFQIFISYIYFLILSKCDNLNDELNSIINEYESNISQAKIISCINLLHSFLSQRDGDQKLKSKIKASQFPSDKLYKKYISSSIKKCYDKINNNQVSFLLTQENTDNYNTLNSSITNLIKFEEIKDIELTNEEQSIYEEISQKFSDFSFNKTKKKKKKGFYEENKIWIITFFIIIGSILFYFRYLQQSEKKVQKKNIINEKNKKQNKRKGKKINIEK